MWFVGIYAYLVWTLVATRRQFRSWSAVGLVIAVEATLVFWLITLHPPESAIGLLHYLVLTTLLAGFLLPHWTIWATAAVNLVAIAVFVARVHGDALNELARMTAARAVLTQAIAAAMVWFFATRLMALLRHKERQLEEKQVLLREIHHRVKNNLQIVSSLLGLQAQRTDDEEGRRAIAETKRRILAMAAAHDAVYAGTDLGRVSLPEYLTAVIRYTEQAASRPTVTVHSKLAPVSLDMGRAIPVGLVLGELLMNALKHAFPGERPGSVEVSLVQEDDHLRLCVGDDGVGLPEERHQDTKSLGFTLVRALTDQLDGELSIDGSAGTRVALALAASPTP
jgi:two-component sensor histidine kinase